MNLCLAVCAPEPAGTARAGWHRIASWFSAIDLFDDVYLERATGGKSTFDLRFAADAPRPGAIGWPLEKDLCYRAVRLLEAHCGEQLPVVLRLRKRIPGGGGLGGGSSNAAAVLRGMNSLFGLGIEEAELMRISQSLGSDVAFFMDGELDSPPRAAMVRGFGERIERVERVRGDVTLVLPEFGCATPEVYGAFDSLIAGREWAFRDGDVAEIAAASTKRGAVDGRELFNDLRAAAEKIQPRLVGIFDAIERTGRRAMLSGSGSTIFVLGDGLLQDVSAVVHRTRLV